MTLALSSPVSLGALRREHHRWFSPALGRDMELVIYGHAGARVLVFPTRQGRFYDYENFGVLEGVRERIETGHFQFYCVDSIDSESFYCRGRPPAERIQRHQQYERYLLNEVVPLTESKNPHGPLIAHGCSLGAYHAVNIALRHPWRFVKVLGLSGRYDLTCPTAEFPDLLDGYFDEAVYYHMPAMYIPNLGDPRILTALRQLHVVLVVGSEDPFLGSNLHLAGHLRGRGATAELHLWEGRAHKARYWRQMVQYYL